MSVNQIILIGVYGDVVRVKILYNKRDSALVQFKEPQQIHTGTSVAYRLPYLNDDCFCFS